MTLPPATVRRFVLVAVVACLAACAGIPATAKDAPTTRPDSVSFTRDVAPVLLRRCQGCHGPDKAKGGYRLDSFAVLTKPGDSGDAPLRPGKPDRSNLFHLITTTDADDRMPKKADPLTDSQVA